MSILSKSLSGVLLLFLVFIAANTSAESRLYDGKDNRCRALGLKELGEFVKPRDVQCFRRVRKAKTKGYIAASGGILAAKPEIYEFDLDGANAVPPANTTATGSCTAILNAAKDLLRVVCEHTAATADKAHVHLAAAGEKGPKFCIATSPASPIGFNCPMDASLVDALHNGELYINIHSTDHPPGELRSQIQ